MRNPTAPKHAGPEQIEKVNKTLGKKRRMQECYWTMPDKNMTEETTMQTTCSSGKRIAARQRWELQITTWGNFLGEIKEKNKGDIHIKKSKRSRCAERLAERRKSWRQEVVRTWSWKVAIGLKNLTNYWALRKEEKHGSSSASPQIPLPEEGGWTATWCCCCSLPTGQLWKQTSALASTLGKRLSF